MSSNVSGGFVCCVSRDHLYKMIYEFEVEHNVSDSMPMIHGCKGSTAGGAKKKEVGGLCLIGFRWLHISPSSPK